jgi:hypothetical protein
MNEIPDDSNQSDVSKWAMEIDAYDRKTEKWRQKARKILDRYRDERKGTTEDRANRFNSLWANIASLQPSLYAKLPNPEVERRYLDQDKAARAASECLQRAIKFNLNDSVHEVFRQVVFDYLSVGRGVPWVRYVPHFTKPESGLEEIDDDGSSIYQNAEAETSITWEECIVDYINYADFGHTEGRFWSEVKAVWRRVYMDRESLRERFPEFADEIPLNFGADEKHNNESSVITQEKRIKKAVIYELWDKSSQKVYWLCKDFKKILDEQDDPLSLEGFFPCPRPIYSSLTNDSLTPIPDYTLYQDQALELDDLCQRITELNKAIKVAGVYDKNCDGIQRILNEGVDNKLIPVDSWAMFAEKGGLKGAVDWLPIGDIVSARNELEKAFTSTKDKMDEITGMIDIKRGATNANETATAQNLKSNYSNIRLRDRQAEVQRIIRDTVVIIGQIISTFFEPETLKQMTGLKYFDTQAQKSQIIQQIQQTVQAGKQPPQLPEGMEEMLAAPAWDEIVGLLHDKTLRNFRIDIETDSTIAIDQQEEKSGRMEFLTMLTQAMEKLVPMAMSTPALAPLIGDMVLFGVKGYRVGRQLESRIEGIIEKLEKQAQQPSPAAPSPEAIKAEAEKAKIQADMQANQAKMQHEQQMKLLDAQIAEKQASLDAQIEQIKQQAQIEHSRVQNELETQRALIQHDLDMQMKQIELQVKMFQSMKQSSEMESESESEME